MALVYDGILLRHEKVKMLPFAKTWLDLEVATPSEPSQAQTGSVGLTLKRSRTVGWPCWSGTVHGIQGIQSTTKRCSALAEEQS